MKSVLISIQPKWCELIASGKKTVEVRKTKPKLETPFKVYIYCTKDNTDNVPSRIWWKADVILTANVKTEAYKEFAERLKKKYKPYVILGSGVAEIEIDNLVKEMVGENNA